MKATNLLQTAALLVVFVSAPLAASAAERAWITSCGGRWYDTNNWSPPGAPDPGDDLTFRFGGEAYILPAFTVSNRMTWAGDSPVF